MSELIPRLSDAREALRGDQSRVPREVTRQVQREYGRGLVAVARLEVGAFVAHTGMAHITVLSKDEEHYILMSPLGEPRYRLVGDAYALYVAGELGNLARRRP